MEGTSTVSTQELRASCGAEDPNELPSFKELREKLAWDTKHKPWDCYGLFIGQLAFFIGPATPTASDRFENRHFPRHGSTGWCSDSFSVVRLMNIFVKSCSKIAGGDPAGNSQQADISDIQLAYASGFQSVFTLIHSYPTHLQQLDTQHRKKSSRPLRMATTIQPTCEFHVGFNFLQTPNSKRFFTCLWLRKQSQTVTWNLILALFGPPQDIFGWRMPSWMAGSTRWRKRSFPTRPPACSAGRSASGRRCSVRWRWSRRCVPTTAPSLMASSQVGGPTCSRWSTVFCPQWFFASKLEKQY